MSPLRITTLLTILTLSPIAHAADPAPAAPTLAFNKANLAALTADFKSNNIPAMNARLPTLTAWLKSDHVPAELWKDILPPLITQNRDAEVADLSLLGILGRPEGRAYHYLLPDRIEALLRQDNADDALAAAKSYYNVADEKHLKNAIQFVAMALQKAHPTDPTFIATFKAQQDAPTPPADPVLKSITIDQTPYTPALAHWKSKADAGKLADKLMYANLLLIADHPTDAEPLFRALLKEPATPAETATINDGLAAALRAQDGNPARGKSFLAEQPAPANTPKPDKDLP